MHLDLVIFPYFNISLVFLLTVFILKMVYLFRLSSPSFLFFCASRFINEFDNIKTRLNSYFIFNSYNIIYALNRYSGWGNDGQVHIFYF